MEGVRNDQAIIKYNIIYYLRNLRVEKTFLLLLSQFNFIIKKVNFRSPIYFRGIIVIS